MVTIGVFFFRLQSIESANENLRLEAEKCKSALEAVRYEKTSLEQRVNDLDMSVKSYKDEIRLLEAELRKLRQREKDNKEVSVINVNIIFLFDLSLIAIDYRRSDQRVGNISNGKGNHSHSTSFAFTICH